MGTIQEIPTGYLLFTTHKEICGLIKASRISWDAYYQYALSRFGQLSEIPQIKQKIYRLCKSMLSHLREVNQKNTTSNYKGLIIQAKRDGTYVGCQRRGIGLSPCSK